MFRVSRAGGLLLGCGTKPMEILHVSLLPQAIDMQHGRQETNGCNTLLFWGPGNKGVLGLAEAPNALEALAIIEVLQRGDEEIKCIRSRQEGEIGVEMLRVLAKEEEEELPVTMG